jgi:hypothetical protein
VKFALPLALLFLLAACTTTSNRRELFARPKAHGPWTMKSRGLTLDGRYSHDSQVSHYVVRKYGGPSAPSTPPPDAPTPALPAQ